MLLAGVLTLRQDLHGPPILSGTCIASTMFAEMARRFWGGERFAWRSREHD